MELMDFLYRVMEELADAGVPIVFKGAMVLNLAIRENNPSKVERITRDIDGDWIGGHPTMEEMEKALRKAVQKVDSSLDVQISRQFGERKSAGFKIMNESGEKIGSIDLSVRHVMSFVTEINAEELRQIWRETGREPGNFEAFRTRSDELQIAYDKMKGVENKPDFCDVYDRVSGVVHHFDTH